ncbi:MAG: hypothetical protein RL238_165 [Actinomycetota bacterium]
MTPTEPARGSLRDMLRATLAVGVALALVGIGEAWHHIDRTTFAATNAGALQPTVPSGPTLGSVLTAGGSATAFSLTPPAGAACTGDSATDGYRVQTYIVPASVDPATLRFDSTGPLPAGTGAALRLPLFATTGTPIVDRTTGVKTSPTSGGLITGLPTVNFAVFGASGPTVVPPGTYNVGVACTLGNPSATQVDRFWNMQLTFATTPADLPSGITWVTGTPPPPVTTTAAPTTAAPTTAAPTTAVPTTAVPTTAVPTTAASTTTTTTAATTTTTAATTTTTTTAATTTAAATTTTAAATTTTTPGAPSTTIDDDEVEAPKPPKPPRECRGRGDDRHERDRGAERCTPRPKHSSGHGSWHDRILQSIVAGRRS